MTALLLVFALAAMPVGGQVLPPSSECPYQCRVYSSDWVECGVSMAYGFGEFSDCRAVCAWFWGIGGTTMCWCEGTECVEI